MPTTINLNGDAWPTAKAARVYTKTAWADPWVLDNTVLVQEAIFSNAPVFSRASLHRKFGRIKQPGSDVIVTVSPIATRGYFVLIIWDTEDASTLAWVGYADSAIVVDRKPSRSGHPETGSQEIPCWGMDRMLHWSLVDTTVHKDPQSSATLDWTRKSTSAIFNGDHKRGNRTKDKVEIVGGGAEVHVFENPSKDDSEWWSTADIFEHLIRFHLPTDDRLVGTVPWSVPPGTVLPTWDRPALEPEGRSLYEALTELFPEDRMLGWKVVPTVVDGNPPTVTELQITPFTRTPTAISLPSIGTLPANTDTVTWTSNLDPLTDSELQLDDSDSVDQVVVRGPREIAVGTFRQGSEWVPGYTTSELTLYTNTYSANATWQGLAVHKQREWNQYFRAKTEVENVYHYYPLREDWDGTCDGDPLFEEEPGPETYIPYLGNTEVLPKLPLFAGIDYEGDTASVDESKGKKLLPILVHVEKPNDPGRYVALQNAWSVYGSPPYRLANAIQFDVNVVPDNEQGPGFRFNISGAPQHALRPTFQGNAADPERINPNMWGGYDSQSVLITAALLGDRRPFHALPASVPGVDQKRFKLIDLEHPGLQHVRIAAATVVGVENDGDPITSDGGILRDPSSTLEALCILAHKNLVEPRRTARIRTGRLLGAVQTGQIIQTIDSAAADVIVNEIRISSPVVDGDSPPPIMMDIMASTNRVDIVALVGRVPGEEIDRPARPQAQPTGLSFHRNRRAAINTGMHGGRRFIGLRKIHGAPPGGGGVF